MNTRRAQAANIKYIPNGKRATEGLNWPKKWESSRGCAKNNEHAILRAQAPSNRSHTTTATKATLKASQKAPQATSGHEVAREQCTDDFRQRRRNYKV